MSLVVCLALATFGLSSAWLFSPGPEKVRNWWQKNMGPLAPLAYCQLCSGFWIGLALHLIFAGPHPALAWALGYSGVAWLLGAITNMCLWMKVYYEQQYKIANGNRLKGKKDDKGN